MFRWSLLLGVIAAGAWMARGDAEEVKGVKQQESILRFKMNSLAGKEVDLADYEGRVLLIVNVASKCGYTSQYKQLQQLHERYGEQGLAILGFPCNQFLGQEPGSAAEIADFCRSAYGVSFDMFEKVEVNGDGACQLYKALTSFDTQPKGAGEISWNFEKFVVDRRGMVVARFEPATRPDAPQVVEIIAKELKRPLPSKP